VAQTTSEQVVTNMIGTKQTWLSSEGLADQQRHLNRAAARLPSEGDFWPNKQQKWDHCPAPSVLVEMSVMVCQLTIDTATLQLF
jgi:hypothetical protein